MNVEPSSRTRGPRRRRSRRPVVATFSAASAIALVVGITLSVRDNSAATSAAAAPPPAVRSQARHAASRQMLPDLEQAVPTDVRVRQVVVDGEVQYRLGFRSAVSNLGAGPLVVRGERLDTSTPAMVVDQLVERASGAPSVRRGIGTMQYSRAPDHSHWHYLQFDRYELRRSELRRSELRRAGSAKVLVADHKTGFCLGDRYRLTPAPAATPSGPVYRGRCGLSHPELLEMQEGISVGYGDDYSAFLEGQDLPLDGLPDGRYVLVHRVNSDKQLAELSYDNNASSVLLDLRWQRGQPQVRIVAACPDTDRCDH
jgi:hypothetical protein